MEETPGTVNWNGFFWIGLIGIIASGLLVGAGGDNLWTAAYLNPPFGTEPHVIGGDIVVQRIRGRM